PFQDNDSDVEEDQRTSNEFMADLNVEYHERALLANQKRFYKRYGRDEEYVSSKDEGTTRIRDFMEIAEDEPSVGKAHARSSQWVDITMKKVHRLLFMTDSDDRKHILDYTHVEQFLSLEKVREADVSTSESAPMITSNSKDDSDIQKLLPPLPKLTGADPSGASKMVRNTNLCPIKKRTESNKLLDVQNSCPDRNALPSTEQLILTLMEEVKDSRCSRHMTGVKQYLHRYLKEPGPKVFFGDDSLGDTKRYGSVNCNGITFTRVVYVNGLKHNLISISQLCDANFKILFTKTQVTIVNQNNEVVLIALRRRDVYIIDMSSFNKESNACFLAKASPRVNWLWHKRLSHLNFKNINNLAKHNLVSGLPSLTFSKDKNCSACEKGKHHRASFKTKRSFSINKSLHLLHMDLFGPIKPQTISHNQYTIVIVDEYSRYTWVFCLKKKSDAADCIMSFIRKMENLNEVRVKELRSDNGTEFRNHKLEKLCDEKEDKKWKKTVHVTFSKDDEAISQTSTEGDAINFNENRSFPDDEFIEPRTKDTQCSVNIKYFPYVFAYENITSVVFPTLQNSVTSEEPLEFTIAGDLSTIHEPDHAESADILESAESQDNVLSKTISDDQPAPVISPSPKVILQNLIPQDSWSREKHIKLVNIIGEPLAGITTRSKVRDSDAASEHECLYVNFLSEIEPKKLIDALEEEGWVIAMQEELNQFERNKVWT
ncbi:retrovirus-related pol polyprotein from transposon TNT 1-94, partial [Tanacetum coccineum]